MYKCPCCSKQDVPLSAVFRPSSCRACRSALRIRQLPQNHFYLAYFALTLLAPWSVFFIGASWLLVLAIVGIQFYLYEFEEDLKPNQSRAET